jgi:hypothetical protein
MQTPAPRSTLKRRGSGIEDAKAEFMNPIPALVTALLLGSPGALHAAEPPFDPVRLDVLTPPIAPNLDRPGDVL